MLINIEKVILDHERRLAEQHAVEEVKKVGTLRGGSAGCLLEDGRVIGACPRSSLLRALGIEKLHGPSAQFMFNAGTNTETELMSSLEDLKQQGYEVLQEQSLVSWQTDGGRYVTGRPDFVVKDSSGQAQGIELKTIVAMSSADRVYTNSIPDAKHLCQAGFYSMVLDIPWLLLYWSHGIHTNYKRAKIQPFRKYFDLFFRKDVLAYEVCGMGKVVDTLITKTGIKDYYNLIDECINEKVVPPKVSSIYADGSTMPYDMCKYCELSKHCEQNHSFATFITEDKI